MTPVLVLEIGEAVGPDLVIFGKIAKIPQMLDEVRYCAPVTPLFLRNLFPGIPALLLNNLLII